MKVLITGITGFVGSHLAESYLADGHEVFGTYIYHHLDDEMERIEGIKNDIKLFDCDLRDRASVYRVISGIKPDIIHHLAAQSFVKASWDNPEFTIFNNIGAELNVFEVCRQLKLDPVIHIAGSSEEYGHIKPEELPVKEDNPLRPMSPYAVSKVAQDMLAQQYHISYKMKTVITRGFNHEGPRRGRSFVTSSFASQVVEILKNKIDPIIKVGNLEAKRDYTDISDMVEAYRVAVRGRFKFFVHKRDLKAGDLLEHNNIAFSGCKYGEPYNICSGETRTIQEILDYYIKKTEGKTIVRNGLAFRIDIKVEQDPARMRPSDLPVLLGDSTKFREATSWKPTVSFERMLDRIFDYWMEK